MCTKHFLGLTSFCWQPSWQIKVPSHHSRGLLDIPGIFWQPPSLSLPTAQVPQYYWSPNMSFLFGFGGLLPWAPLQVFSKGLALNWILLWIRPHLTICVWWGCNFGGQIFLDLFHWHTSTESSESLLGLPQQICLSFVSRFWGQFVICKDEQSHHSGRGRSLRKAADEGLIAKVHSAWWGRVGCWCFVWEVSTWRLPSVFFWLVLFWFMWIFFPSMSQINARDFTKRGNSHFHLLTIAAEEWFPQP